MNPKLRDLCIEICSLDHTCVMAEHPERETCSAENCHVHRGVTSAMLAMASAVERGREAFVREVAVMPGSWPHEAQVKAIQAMVPYLLETAEVA